MAGSATSIYALKPWTLSSVMVGVTLLCLATSVAGQRPKIGFQFGATYGDIDMVRYEKDTSAAVVVLQEYGERIVTSSVEQVYRYHVKYKVLKPAGTKVGNVEVQLRKPRRFQTERITYLRAAAFNLDGPSLAESTLDSKDVLVSKVSRFYEVRSFIVPNVRVGSVVEVEYEVTSPFVLDFKDWFFQGVYPKVVSEFRFNAPEVVVFNITLKGSLELESVKNESTPDCPSDLNCQNSVYKMRDVPAFVEEAMMPAAADYLSRIDFELWQIRPIGGQVMSMTMNWNQLDSELHNDEWFEGQMTRGNEIAMLIPEFKTLPRIGDDTLALARGIHAFVRDWFEWNTDNSFYTPDLKKAFESRKGDSGDINMTLIALLRTAGYHVDPVILSTTEHGQPTDSYPLLGDFNYVLGRIVIGSKDYLVDAVDKLAPFGVIPRNCYNGDGRLIVGKGSHWYGINPTEKNRDVSIVNFKIETDGSITGTLEKTFFGYKALQKRHEIKKVGEQEYLGNLKRSSAYTLETVEHLNLQDFQKPVVEKWVFKVDPGTESSVGRFQFNPFALGDIGSNPFKADMRTYPVAFGLPVESKTTVMVEYPPGMELLAKPERVGVSLPGNGGRYLLAAEATESKVVINEIMILSKLQYSPDEYPYLKELFARAIQGQSVDLIFQRMK